MKHVLVTGATGCIGHVLVRVLAESGYAVTALALDKEEVDRIAGLANVSVVFGDICDDQSMTALFSGGRFDVVVHLAAIVHQPAADEQDYMRVNYEATASLFGLAKSYGVGQFVFVSTVAVHGDDIEDAAGADGPVNPQTPYAVSKSKAEAFLRDHHDDRVRYTIVRPTTVYGKYDRGNVNRLFKSLHRGIVPIIGDGSSLKCFVYVENLVDGIVRTVLNEKAYNQIFILSDESPCSINELLRVMAAVAGRKALVIRVPAGLAFAVARCVNWVSGKVASREVLPLSSLRKFVTNNVYDISKAKIMLHYRPGYDLAQGLAKTYPDSRPAARVSGR